MAESWIQNKLGDLSIAIFSGGTPATSESKYWNGELNWLSSGETRNIYIRDTDKKITQFGVIKSSTKKAICGDVVIASAGQGSTRGQASICLIDTYINQSIIAIRSETGLLYPKFLLYCMLDRYEELRSISDASSTRGSLTCRILENLPIYYPSFPTQRKIAAILSAYDDLIENNTRRIKILEEMAQNLYREWFVKFRFPGHEHARFVDSPLGLIPEGWEVKTVGEILQKVKRAPKIPKSNYLANGMVPIIDQGREYIGGYTDTFDAVIFNELPLIVFGDHTRVVKYIDFPFVCGADGTQILKSNTERMPISLFYYSLLEIDLSDYTYARHFKFLKSESIILPTKLISALFESIVSQFLEQKRVLMGKNTALRTTRDLLLPRLISGDVDVSDLDITIPEAINA